MSQKQVSLHHKFLREKILLENKYPSRKKISDEFPSKKHTFITEKKKVSVREVSVGEKSFGHCNKLKETCYLKT